MKIKCHCGHLIHDGTDDLPHKAHVFPDSTWNTMWDEIDHLIEHQCKTPVQREEALTRLRIITGKYHSPMWKCDACGRLYINKRDNDPICYIPE